MHEEHEKIVLPNEAAPLAEASPDYPLESHEGGMQGVLTRLQEQGKALLKKIDLDGNVHLEKLGLVDNPEAQKAAERYDAHRRTMMDGVREKIVLAATLMMLTMGAGKVLGAEPGDLEEGFQSTHAEQSVVLEDEVMDTQTAQPPLSESIEETVRMGEAGIEKNMAASVVMEKADGTLQKTETFAKEKPLSTDEKEFRKMSQAVSDIMSACMGLQKDSCLATVTGAAMKHIVLDSLIPFKRGVTSLKEAAEGEKMEAGERFGKVISGIFDLLTDAVTLQMGGKGVIKLAQLYRAYQGVNTATAAYTFYVENKKDVHAALQIIFGGASQERQAVENTLFTLEKVGQISGEKSAPVQIN
ncbi:MAG: hypothetical protein Q7S04_02040 [Candidatus Moranbacteria bacterium]|nr:hypothetical protein [Candidatus Moranbacteria bacterium]